MIDDQVDGLWTIRFQTPAGWVGGGVVVFDAGRLFGGDSRYYYIGDFVRAEGSIRGSFRLRHHEGEDITAFGARGRAHDAILQAEVVQVGTITGVLVGRTHGFGSVACRLTLQHALAL